MALRANKLTGEKMSRCNFQKRKGLFSFRDNCQRRVGAQILLAILLGQALVLLVLPSLFELLDRRSLVLCLRVFLLGDDKLLEQRGAQIVDSFTLALVVCHRCVVTIDRLETSKGFSHS